MNIQTTSDGEMVITLTEQNCNQLYNLLRDGKKSIEVTLFDQPPLPATSANIFKGLRHKSKDFLKELKDHYGNESFDRNDAGILEIEHRLWFKNLDTILRQWAKGGLVELTDINKKGSKIIRIKTIRLLI